MLMISQDVAIRYQPDYDKQFDIMQTFKIMNISIWRSISTIDTTFGKDGYIIYICTIIEWFYD